MDTSKCLQCLAAVQKRLDQYRRMRDHEMEDGNGDDWKIRSQFLQGRVEGLEDAEKIIQKALA